MFKKIFKWNAKSEVPELLYLSILKQARSPAFFEHYGFEDTVMGRFDVLSIHVMMVCRRLGNSREPNAKELSQEVFDTYVFDIETALRSLGIGDTSVPKKKKKMVRTFYGMVEDLEDSLKGRDLAILSAQIQKRYFPGQQSGYADQFANYISTTVQLLDEQPIAGIFKGSISWLPPADL